jgi:hypothetical protein
MFRCLAHNYWMNRSNAVIAIVLTCMCLQAQADTFTTPLAFAPQSNDAGQYLSADFDFHTPFASIDSVTLQFSMPNGFVGEDIENFYGAIHNELWIALHSVDTAPTFGVADLTNLYNFTSGVPAGVPQQFGFDKRIVLSLTYPPILLSDAWPDFLFSGRGSVGIADYQSIFQVEVAGNILISNLLPLSTAEIDDASITIDGTTVPEPATLCLLLAGGIFSIAAKYRGQVARCGVP